MRRRWRRSGWKPVCPGLPETFIDKATGQLLHNTHWYRPVDYPDYWTTQYLTCENCWSVRRNDFYRGTPKTLIHKGRKPRK